MKKTVKQVLTYGYIGLVFILAILPIAWLYYFVHFQKEGSGGNLDIVLNAVLLILWGSVHSILARNFTKKLFAKIVNDEYIRSIYTLIAGITLALLLFFWKPIPGYLWQTRGLLYWVSTAMYIGCVAGMVYMASSVDYLDYAGIRVLLRKLKNQPAKNPEFQADSLYAFCRHPFYLFFLGVLWIGPEMSYSRVEFAAICTVYILIGTVLEERNLRDELGEVYDLYRENVPMWIPRLTPWQYKIEKTHTL